MNTSVTESLQWPVHITENCPNAILVDVIVFNGKMTGREYRNLMCRKEGGCDATHQVRW